MDDSGLRSSESCNQMNRMHDLLEEILEIQRSTQNVDDNLVRVQEIITESSQIVENSTLPNEIVVDAKILNVGSNFFNVNVSSFKTNLTSFSEEKYVSELLSLVEDSDEVVPAGMEWHRLAPKTFHLFRKSNPATFMLGPLTLQPLDPGDGSQSQDDEGKSKSQRQRKTQQKEKEVLACVTESEKPEEEGSDVYEHIFKCLVRRFKRNDRKAVGYFDFIIDPGDYWRTVENIFHFAFLVRDGSVRMSLQNGLPFVEPVSKKTDERTPGKSSSSNQFCLSLSMSEWEDLVDRFQVRSASITPFVKTSKPS